MRRIAAIIATALVVGGVSSAGALTVDGINPIATPPPPVTAFFGGTVAVGNTVVVTEEGGLEPVCDTPVDGAGNWSCSILLQMSGTFVFVITELDAEQQPVATETKTVLVQPTPPFNPPPTGAPPTTTPPAAQAVTAPARFTG